MTDADPLPERPVHQSLVRVPRFAGVDRSFLVLEVTLVVCLVFLLGVSVQSAFVVAVVVGGLHPLMRKLSSIDDLMPQFAARAVTQADAYDPLPPAHTGSRRPARAVPTK